MNLPTSPYLSEIKSLRERLELSEAETAYWKGQVLPANADVQAMRSAYPKLSPAQVRLLVALSSGKVLAHDTLLTVIAEKDDVESNIVGVTLWKLTRNLPWLVIKNFSRVGWQLDAASLASIRNAMHRQAA